MNVQFLSVVQIILAIVLIGLVLLQTKGTGLGSTFGGELGFYQTRRGFEKLLFKATLATATLFLLVAILGLLG